MFHIFFPVCGLILHQLNKKQLYSNNLFSNCFKYRKRLFYIILIKVSFKSMDSIIKSILQTSPTIAIFKTYIHTRNICLHHACTHTRLFGPAGYTDPRKAVRVISMLIGNSQACASLALPPTLAPVMPRQPTRLPATSRCECIYVVRSPLSLYVKMFNHFCN